MLVLSILHWLGMNCDEVRTPLAKMLPVGQKICNVNSTSFANVLCFYC